MKVETRYQPEIQGLRAIAIASVLLFHVGLGGFAGGFLGVDVFFVISGYLITRLIVTEIDRTGTFRFGRFYLRRARRLLPAAMTALAATAAVAAAILTPEDLARFGRSLAAAALSVSNLAFWRESGYFDVGADYKPLLHTWSLGVEEQFYLFWPLFIVLVMKRPRLALGAIAAAGAVSFALNGVALATDIGVLGDVSAAVFFLMPFRIFEFAIGASLVWLLPRVRVPRRAAEPLLVAALAAIAVPVVLYDEATRFPYWAALPPCLGTAAAILTIGRSRAGALVLANRPAQWLGLVSYSVYLVHWPVVAFMRYADLQPLSPVEVALALVASLALGTGLYRFVEKPLRHPSGAPRRRGVPLAAAGAAAAAAIVAGGVTMAASGGWAWRVPAAERTASDADLRRQEDARFCSRRDPSKPAGLFTCQYWRGAADDIIVWGDSHALHLVGGFVASYPRHNVYVLNLNGCVPQSGFGGYAQRLATAAESRDCVRRNRAAIRFLSSYRPSTVVLTSAKRGRPERIAAVSDTLVRDIAALGHRPLYLGDFIRPGRVLRGCASLPRLLIGSGSVAARCAPDPELVRQEVSYNRRVAAASPAFIDPRTVQCATGSCRFAAAGRVLFRDDHHLDWHGAQYFVARLKPILRIPEPAGEGRVAVRP